MKKRRIAVQQIVAVLKQAETGMPVEQTLLGDSSDHSGSPLALAIANIRTHRSVENRI